MGFRECRTKSGLSAKDAALKVGITTQSIYGFENGQYLPSVNILQKLAQAYGCTMEELLEGEEKPDD